MASSNATAAPLPEEIMGSLTTIVSGAPGEVVLVTAVDRAGRVGDTDVFASNDHPKSSLPLDQIFNIAEAGGTDTVMVTSRAAGPLETITESDIAFTRALIDAADEQGIEVLDHVLVRDGDHKRMRAITELWN